MRTTWRWALVSAGALLSAVTQTSAQSRANGGSEIRIPISKDSPPPEKGNVTYIDVDGANTTIPAPEPLPAFRVADYLNLNDANLVYHMATRDSIEIALAMLAQNKATDPRVREFAVALEKDRGVRLGKVIHVMNDENTGTSPTANDYALMRLRQVYARFDSLPSGPTWDVDFMKVQFFQQQNEIDVLDANRPNVQVEDVLDRVDYSLRMLTTQRESARNILASLGATLP